MECYFNQTFGFDELDELIREFKQIESDLCKDLFIKELHNFIETKKYRSASRFIKKYGDMNLDEEKTEKFINYLYDRLLDNPTKVKATDFIKKYRVVFCPVCTPDSEAVMEFGIIDKATVIGKDIQIYVCKLCKLVWLDEDDIRADNAQDYKKFMRANGFKGLWKELTEVDVL